MARLEPKQVVVARLRRRRDRARAWAFGGFGLLFFAGLTYRYGSITLLEGRKVDAVALLGFVVATLGYLAMAAGLVLFVGGSLAWMAAAWRLHTVNDPWAYDPDLDGPDPHKRHELDDRFREEP